MIIKRITLFLKLLLVCLTLLLTSCLEVKQTININRDGSGDARLEIGMLKEYGTETIQKIKQKIKEDMSKWNIVEEVEEKEKEGKHIIVLSRKFKEISELNDDEAKYSFSSEKIGFLKKSYILEITQLRSSEMSLPYEIFVKVPGSIDETNGTKISSNEVKWNLQGLRRGKELSVKSSGFALPDFASLKESFNRAFDSVFYRKAIVFLRDRNLWVMDSDGKNQRQLTKENVRNFSVSRDGKIVFYKPKTFLSRNGDQETFKVEDLNLYMLDINTGESEKLTSDDRSREGVIAPNGTKIIFEKADWTDPDYGCCGKGIWLLDLRERTEKEIINEIPFPSEISGKFPWLHGKEWFGDFNFVWSEDDKKVAFSRNYGKEWPYAYLLSLDEPQDLIHIGKSFRDFGVGIMITDIHAGKLLFKTSEMDYGSNLYLYDIKSAKSFLLHKNASNGKFSPDGKKIVFLGSKQGAGSIWITDVVGKNKRIIYNGDPWFPAWSPDGRKILFQQYIKKTQKTGIFTIDSDGSNLKKLADNADVPRWLSTTRVSFISPRTAKILMLAIIVLTGISLLFGMALIVRRAVKAAAPKPKTDRRLDTGSIFCTQCGTQNPESASFCKKCGGKLG